MSLEPETMDWIRHLNIKPSSQRALAIDTQIKKWKAIEGWDSLHSFCTQATILNWRPDKENTEINPPC